MAVISITPRCTWVRGGASTMASEANRSPAIPAHANTSRRRVSNKAAANATAATTQVENAGIGNRTSEIRQWPMRRIAPVSSDSEYPETSAGKYASQYDTYDN